MSDGPKGRRLWEVGRSVQVDICPDDDAEFVATIGRVSVWLKREEAQDLVGTLTRALLRAAALDSDQKPDLGPEAMVAALQAILRAPN
jgi:hypothetical protein